MIRPPRLAARAMRHPLLPLIYERVWRPVGFTVLSAGRGTDAEQRRIEALLRLRADARVLDVACGPGNTTRRLLAALGPEARITGLDAAPRMVARARADTEDPRARFVLGDAAALPFPDAGFDAVTCLGALYLIEDVEGTLDELVRVLAPGGRLVVLTSAHRGPGVLHPSLGLAAGLSGFRMFGPDEMTAALRSRGLTDVTRELTGFLQLAGGSRPT